MRHLIQSYRGEAVEIGLLGVPSDLGVVRGGGRAGAASGPRAVRAELRRYGTAYNCERGVDLSLLKIADFGDVVVDRRSVPETHRRVAAAVEAILKLGALPILIGGGHDITFSGVQALCRCMPGQIGGITIDAHFDVREPVAGEMTSGTPFRLILEELDKQVRAENFVEIGANGCVNARVHFEYLLKKGVRVFFLHRVQEEGIESVVSGSLDRAGHGAEAIFFSIDMDAAAQAYAPGVSAPSPEGFTPDELCTAAFLAGQDPQVHYFDIMEINPRYDQDNRTARLGAALIIHFLCGFAMRERGSGT